MTENSYSNITSHTDSIKIHDWCDNFSISCFSLKLVSSLGKTAISRLDNLHCMCMITVCIYLDISCVFLTDLREYINWLLPDFLLMQTSHKLSHYSSPINKRLKTPIQILYKYGCKQIGVNFVILGKHSVVSFVQECVKHVFVVESCVIERWYL